MSTPIQVWRFENAPVAYRELSTNGGDEDWLVFWPESAGPHKYGLPLWLLRMDSCEEPQEIRVDGGTVFIGSHA